MKIEVSKIKSNVQNVAESDKVTKRYYHFLIICQPQNKVVQDVVLFLTEREFHEKSFQIAEGLRKNGMAYNGKNNNHYFDFLTRDINDEYLKVKKATDKYFQK